MDRDLDVIVYGATGFTGRLVAQHLRDAGHEGLRWGIAGRSKDKLEGVAGELGLADVPIVIADSGDPTSVAAMTRRTKVVCTTVGPYARFGEPVLASCAAEGTDYVDLTGEVHWVAEMIAAHGPTAERTGARIVHSCGFDSVPSDLGTYFAQRQMHARHGVFASHVSGRVKGARGGVSGATIASGLDLVDEARRSSDVRRLLADPYSLNPEGQPTGPAVRSGNTPFLDKDFNRWVAPFVMAAINARIVRRSAALLGTWGQAFTYDEMMFAPGGASAPVAAAGITAALGVAGILGGLATAIPGGRGLLDRVLPDPGTGPSAAAQASGFFDLRFHAQHPDDPEASIKVKVLGDRDPGYGATSRMIGECAVALAMDESPVGGGSWTPASALGDALLERLPAHAGVTFELLGQ